MANLVIWNEFIHEQEDEVVKSIYPHGIHQCIKDFLKPDEGLNISTAPLLKMITDCPKNYWKKLMF